MGLFYNNKSDTLTNNLFKFFQKKNLGKYKYTNVIFEFLRKMIKNDKYKNGKIFERPGANLVLVPEKE